MDDTVTDTMKALEIAVHQNSHDMLMTAEEIRLCEEAITKMKIKSDKTSERLEYLENLLEFLDSMIPGIDDLVEQFNERSK